MRILLWHGYLLGGTGSNVYTRALAREWSNAGHDVVVVSRSASPSSTTSAARSVAVELPGGLLPVFVHGPLRRAGAEAPAGLHRGGARAYVEANAAALRELLPADLVFANHVLMGGAGRRATGVPFRVKAHGSELEYSMRGRPELEAWGREALARAEATYVGSRHIREVLEDVVGQVERVFEVPPGVDVDEFVLAGPRRGARRPGRRGARRPAEPGNATSGCRTRATPSGSRRSSPATSRPSSTSGS